ncbi:hypothetical protein ACFX2I_047204 [Malus domestica]
MASMAKTLIDFSLGKSRMVTGDLDHGQFPRPQIDAVTNDNLAISVFNYLPEPFLISWWRFCGGSTFRVA